METGQFARSIPALRAGYSSDDLVNTKNRSGPASDGIVSPDEASSLIGYFTRFIFENL